MGFGFGTWREQRLRFHIFSVGASWALIGGSFFGLHFFFFFFFFVTSRSTLAGWQAAIPGQSFSEHLVLFSLFLQFFAPVLSESLQTLRGVAPRDANLASGLATGGIFGMLLGRSPKAAAAGVLTGAFTVMLGTLTAEAVEKWRIGKALKRLDEKSRIELGLGPEHTGPTWIPTLPKWLPLKVIDLSKPQERSEGEKARALDIFTPNMQTADLLFFHDCCCFLQTDIQILKLEKEIKEKEAKLRQEDLQREQETKS